MDGERMKYAGDAARPMHLKYVGIRVTDLERSLKFYTEVLGLKEDRRGDSRKFGLGIWVLLRDDTSGERIELNWYAPESKYATPYVPGEGLDHLGFVVDDVRAKYREMLEKGAAPTGVTPDDTEDWTAYVKDPDGNWIEIFQLMPPTPKPVSR